MSDPDPRYSTERQALIDAFYFAKGPCCAGCDFWHHINSIAGICHRFPKHVGPSNRKPYPFGITSCSLGPVSQALTTRDDWCGEFRDTYDWPPHIRRRLSASPSRSMEDE